MKATVSQFQEAFCGDSIHTVYEGLREVDGVETGERALVCIVGEKLTAQQLKAQGQPCLPRKVYTPHGALRVDVVVGPQPTDMLLHPHRAQHRRFVDSEAQAVTDCHNCPVPGGSQIKPRGVDWVGTLGCAFAMPAKDGTIQWGAMTNYHVAVKPNPRLGVDKMIQPHEPRDHIGVLKGYVGLNFGRGINTIDFAFIDTLRTGGKYGKGVHTVGPTQVRIGDYDPRPIMQPKLGDRVVKFGRTTGYTTGRCVGINARTNVAYSKGNAAFHKQLVIKADRGNFSQPGDSGSLILNAENQPWGLLFAGGGGRTIANPLSEVLRITQGFFFGQKHD